MQGVILLLFAKYYHLPFLRNVQTDCTRTGLGGYWVSTGGVRRLVPRTRTHALAKSPPNAPPLTLTPASPQPHPVPRPFPVGPCSFPFRRTHPSPGFSSGWLAPHLSTPRPVSHRLT